jgi:hypothetical protein
MKHFKSLLNPLNPILPAFLLGIAFLWFGYSDFVKRKYTEDKKTIFKEGIEFTNGLSDSYRHQTINEAKEPYGDYEYGFCKDEAFSELYRTTRQLDKLVNEIIADDFDKIDFSKQKNISLIPVFEKYIKEAQNVNPILKKRYKNFDLENNLTDSQLNQLYFSRNELESNYHLARFKAQLLEMYYDDIKFLEQETLANPVEGILSNYIIKPQIFDGNRNNNDFFKGKNILHLLLLVPFDTTKAEIIFPKNVETRFDEKGFLIIPPSLRNSGKKLIVGGICGTDSTFYIKEDL